ncbi:MAG: Gfo/Idh/MocA family oxidoreductase [Candidatus Pacebacteria bacterium]|nr:Gfo/Idh/MocA family oxidoreductase [Candidatus Paceibacterota bacterium]
MGKKLKAGVIGGGGSSTTFHAPVYLADENIEFVGILDPAEISRQRCLKTLGPLGLTASQLFDDEKVFMDQGLDMVSICVPNVQHRSVMVACAEKKIHVLCEKPPAINAGEVAEMISAAESANVKLVWQFNNRFRPEARWMWSHIFPHYNSPIGDIVTAQAEWVRRNGIPGRGSWFTQKAMSGGGPIIDLSIHVMDLALFAMGYPKPTYVMATASDLFINDMDACGPWGFSDPDGIMDVETASQGMVLFEGGKSMQYRASWAERIVKERVACVMQGTKGGVLLERTFGQDGIDDTAIDKCIIVQQSFGQPSNNEFIGLRDPFMGRRTSVKAFIDSIVSGQRNPLLPEPEDGLTMMKMIDAMYESAKTGKPVEIVW